MKYRVTLDVVVEADDELDAMAIVRNTTRWEYQIDPVPPCKHEVVDAQDNCCVFCGEVQP